MNLLIISPGIYPCTIGGVEIFNYYFLKELAKRGNKVYILTICRSNWADKNISSIYLSKKILLHPILSICFGLFLKLIELRRKIDIIHVPYTSNSFLAYPIVVAKKLFNIPGYVILVHGGGMKPWKPKVVQQLFFGYADAVLAISENIRLEYEKRCHRRIKVIPPLIPFQESTISKQKLKVKYGFNSKDMILLFLGTLKKTKGCDVLLDAFLSLGIEYLETNNLKLLYIGDGQMKPILEKKIKNAGFNKYVKFLGRIRHEKIPDMYNLSDIYIIPSMFEGTPIALLEAMFNGLPIIGTDTIGINNIVRDKRNGLLFKKGDAIDLKEKIKNLVDNEELRIRLGTDVKTDYLKTYNFEESISEHIKLYESIIMQAKIFQNAVHQ